MIDYTEKIPNNVNLSEDRRLLRALETWQPNFQEWWREMGPSGFQQDQVYLRTAVSVEPGGWAHFDYVRMPEYRWGLFLVPATKDARIGFGDYEGLPVWNEVPGELRNWLRRIIVTQGDTEPASVEQQRLLGHKAPSLYDLRNLFQVNVEEGRHLWAMVYLLHRYFGRDGRDEAEELLHRRSGHRDKPRILGAFNQPIENWLDFLMFTMFTDRDGKYQLLSLSESGFDPLARTTKFMLTEEAHHMFVGETGVQRVVQRTCELMRQDPNEDARNLGGIDLPAIQKYVNLWYSLSADLFGGEISTNAANYFGTSLKGRNREASYTDHKALDGAYRMVVVEGGALAARDVPLRNAMNEVLRDSYIEDCQRACERWNRVIERHSLGWRLKLPDRKFHRQVGIYAGRHFTPEGIPIADEDWERRRGEWLPSESDRAYVESLMTPVYQRGRIANWTSPPERGINGLPFDFEYVRFDQER
ncbi:MAG: benzoyl-CoA 2,3-epoxidase subunit BoxB [Acidobacteriia bacterium]|nr:benzoyl-CoA 2,3-epoxidase subunit BoxB [Terriglobia bacterium]